MSRKKRKAALICGIVIGGIMIVGLSVGLAVGLANKKNKA
ncbi:hypothetical protein [Ureaplasma canigenitalium]|nr:hypothetical protein [Ureaplasma canigenitalium]